jgi:hypothetical protein
MIPEGVYSRVLIMLGENQADSFRMLASDLADSTRRFFSAPSPASDKSYTETLELVIRKAFSGSVGYCVYYGLKAEELRDALLKLKGNKSTVRHTKVLTEHLVSYADVKEFLKDKTTTRTLAKYPEFAGFLRAAVQSQYFLFSLTCSSTLLPDDIRKLAKISSGMVSLIQWPE